MFMIQDHAVSEIVGALALVAVISLAVSIVGVVILSSTETAEIPSVTVRITNVSSTIYVVHEGGDSLSPGSYRIYVDGLDRTGSFSPGGGSTEFRAGALLQSDGSYVPSGSSMLVFRRPDGSGVVLVTKYFSP
jgi:hypothetical protein